MKMNVWNKMKFSAKEMIIFAAIFALGFAIYMIGSVLNDFDIDIARLKGEVIELRAAAYGSCELNDN